MTWSEDSLILPHLRTLLAFPWKTTKILYLKWQPLYISDKPPCPGPATNTSLLSSGTRAIVCPMPLCLSFLLACITKALIFSYESSNEPHKLCHWELSWLKNTRPLIAKRASDNIQHHPPPVTPPVICKSTETDFNRRDHRDRNFPFEQACNLFGNIAGTHHFKSESSFKILLLDF